MNPESDFRIIYQGADPDAAFLGYAQANFVLRWENRSAREVAIFVNTPALEYVAAQLERELTPDVRDEFARLLGQELLKEYAEPELTFDPNITISKAVLVQKPQLIEGLRAALQPAS